MNPTKYQHGDTVVIETETGANRATVANTDDYNLNIDITGIILSLFDSNELILLSESPTGINAVRGTESTFTSDGPSPIPCEVFALYS